MSAVRRFVTAAVIVTVVAGGVTGFPVVGQAAADTSPAPITLTGTVRDFEHTTNVCSTGPINPDFENAVADDRAIVGDAATSTTPGATLDGDGKPVYAVASGGTATTANAASFNQWYRQVDGVNKASDYALTLTPQSDSSQLGYHFHYANDSFFPADGQGWADPSCPTPQLDASHNFSFTFQLHTTFTYTGGETFAFDGDDDVFVYLNKQLVVNLGGVHGPEHGEVALDTIAAAVGMTKGGSYPFDLFFAERHTSGSDFSMDTSIALNPTLAVSNLSVTASSATTGPGAADVPLSSIPATSLPSSAVDALASTPLRSVPLRSVPLRSVPLRSVPLRSVPLTTSPLSSVLLSQVPLTGTTWDAVLLGTALAGRTLQTVTLQQAYDAISVAGYTGPGVTLDQMDLSQTPLRDLTAASVFLGGVSLNSLAIPPPSSGGSSSPTDPNYNYNNWCAYLAAAGTTCAALNLTNNSPLFAADIQGAPLRSVPLRSVPLRSVPVGAPLRSVPLRSVDIAGSPLRSVPLRSVQLTTTSGATAIGSIPLASLSPTSGVGQIPLSLLPTSPALVSSACDGCTTLGDAISKNALVGSPTLSVLASIIAAGDYTLSDLGPLPATPAVTVGDLADSLDPTASVTLGDVLLALLPVSSVDWESTPLSPLMLSQYQPAAPTVTYTVSFGISGKFVDTVAGTVVVTLPPDFRYTGTTTGLVAGESAVQNGDKLTFSLVGRTVPTTVTLTFGANAGLTLGNQSIPLVSVLLNGAGASTTASAPETDGGVTVADTAEPGNDSTGAAPAIAADQLVIGHLATAGDIDYYSLAAPPAGTHVHVLLSHLPVDGDLVVYGPADSTASPAAAPLRSVPLRSVPLQDDGVDTSGNSGLTPQALNDVPVLSSLPVVGESAHGGTGSEEVDFLSSGSGSYTVQVSAYNGASSPQPYLLRVTQDTPATVSCSTPQLAAESVLAGGLPVGTASTRSLFLVNTQQLTNEYGSTAAGALLSQLRQFVTRGDVAGLVVPVDADSATVNAYNAWNANACSTTTADTVVDAINGIVRSYVGGSAPGITSVTLVGSDRQLPMYRTPDLTLSANESGYAASDAPSNPNTGNPLSAAQLQGDMLTDDAYGSLHPVSWLGRRLYLPDLAVGRLVESPGEIGSQLNQFVSAGGALTPKSALTTGYDFLADGARAVDSALATDGQAVTGAAIPHTTLIDPPGATTGWTRSQLLAALFPTGTTAVSPYVDSINGHFDHNRALSSAENISGAQSDLVTVNDVTANSGRIPGRILFSMGCHAGLNVPDAYVTDPSEQKDWAQTFAQQNAIWIANTGYGLGDTATVALSEELMRLLAVRLNGSMTAGQALQYAKQAYFGELGGYGVYDEKAMEEPVFYGLPMWRVGGAAFTPGKSTRVPGPVTALSSPTTPPAAGAVTNPTSDTGFSGLTSSDITVNPTFTATTTAQGSYWSIGGDRSDRARADARRRGSAALCATARGGATSSSAPAAAAVSSSNSGSWARSPSACHWTPMTSRSPGVSIARIVPSSAQAVATSPLPSFCTA